MCMASVKLVTAAEDIKVWNGADLELQFSPHSCASETSTVCWSPDGHFLAASSATGDSVTVSQSKCLTSTVELRTDAAQNFVRFGNTSSRTVITCGNHSDVLLWNMKSRTLQKKLDSSLEALNCVTFNWTDTHVACGSSNGEVVLINAGSGIRNPVMKTLNTRSICSLAFNSIAKTQLGALSEDSGFNVWDGNTRALVHAYESKHLAPATGFAFSPVNDKLAVSAGLDKRIIFYDLTQKKIFMSTTLDEPITCIDFMDGMNMTLGTISGKLLFYDLRASVTKETISAHQSPVNSLHYRKCKMIPKSKGLLWNEPSKTVVRPGVDVFSPKPTQQNGAVAGRNPFEFSPLHTLGTPKLADTLNDSPLDVLMNFPKQSDAGDAIRLDVGLMNFDDEGDPTDCLLPSAKLNMAEDLLSSVVDAPSAIPPLEAAAAAAATADSVEPPATNAVTVPSLDFSLLRSVVLDVMDDFSDAVHKDIINLHVDVIKKFQLQQTYFESRLEQLSRNEELLLAEIERLRAEIQRLRMTIN